MKLMKIWHSIFVHPWSLFTTEFRPDVIVYLCHCGASINND